MFYIQECNCGICRIEGKLRSAVWTVQDRPKSYKIVLMLLCFVFVFEPCKRIKTHAVIMRHYRCKILGLLDGWVLIPAFFQAYRQKKAESVIKSRLQHNIRFGLQNPKHFFKVCFGVSDLYPNN